MDQAVGSKNFSQREFRDCLAQFATGVCIVTSIQTDESGKDTLVGLTANSFNSVSLDPPLVLWSLSKRASSMAAFAAHSHYVIHILAADQIELARRFADKSISDRFDGLAFTQGSAGVPILPGCAAWFECSSKSRYDEGDHVIFVGEVERCERRADQVTSPLLYHGGRYFTELPLP